MGHSHGGKGGSDARVHPEEVRVGENPTSATRRPPSATSSTRSPRHVPRVSAWPSGCTGLPQPGHTACDGSHRGRRPAPQPAAASARSTRSDGGHGDCKPSVVAVDAPAQPASEHPTGQVGCAPGNRPERRPSGFLVIPVRKRAQPVRGECRETNHGRDVDRHRRPAGCRSRRRPCHHDAVRAPPRLPARAASRRVARRPSESPPADAARGPSGTSPGVVDVPRRPWHLAGTPRGPAVQEFREPRRSPPACRPLVLNSPLAAPAPDQRNVIERGVEVEQQARCVPGADRERQIAAEEQRRIGNPGPVEQ